MLSVRSVGREEVLCTHHLSDEQLGNFEGLNQLRAYADRRNDDSRSVITLAVPSNHSVLMSTFGHGAELAMMEAVEQTSR